MFSWDLNNIDNWFPFLNKKTPILPGCLQCFYIQPCLVNQFEWKLDYFRMDEPSMIKGLISYIQEYRKQRLLISETFFHREICRTIQSYLAQLEDIFSPKKASGLYKAKSGTSQMLLGSQMTFAAENVWENPIDSSSIKKIREKIAHLIPPHYYWQGCLFQFSDTNLIDIMDQFIRSGYLDYCSSDCMYTLALYVIKKPLGMTNARLIIGYLYNLVE